MTTEEVDVLSDALRDQLGAQVEAEPVDDNGRFRFAVVSPRFQEMTQLEPQDAVWQVVDSTLPKPTTLDISLILAFAPADLAETGGPT